MWRFGNPVRRARIRLWERILRWFPFLVGKGPASHWG